MIPEQPGRPAEQVIEIQGAVGFQDLFIARVHPLRDLSVVGGCLKLNGLDEFILCLGNRGAHGLGPVHLLIDPEIFERASDRTQLLTIVIDDVVGVEACRTCLRAQNSRTDCVESADGQSFPSRTDRHSLSQQPVDALAHLAGGLVGEGHRHDGAWVDAGHAEQVGHAVRQHPRLPGPWPGQHKHRPLDRCHCLTLRRVQAGENIILHQYDLILNSSDLLSCADRFEPRLSLHRSGQLPTALPPIRAAAP